ncbi:Zinc finger CCHC domain-containing 8 [Gossypium australe]|uniref:Zinc finger CCHC domain-containing 8 n=1 Tax=Gossypium australe TaxID=47621 RepID=A0A5B6UX20_9ROSI|nr:Zinc finger CCHC domain-containing 8 [Gossypium australe]
MGASYVDARRRELLNLTQGDRLVAEYEAEFLRLNRYARVQAMCSLRGWHQDSIKVLITPQRERDFATLVDKVKITEEVKRTERQNREKERGRNRRDSEPSSSIQRPKKRPV